MSSARAGKSVPTRCERANQVRDAREAGQITVLRHCKHHGETEFTIEGAGYYRCKRCRMAAVGRRRRRLKELLVAEAGGRCRLCGYDRYMGALEFHHVDPAEKRLEISRNGVTLSIDALRAEAANCHAEVEGGVVVLPDRMTVPRSMEGLPASLKSIDLD